MCGIKINIVRNIYHQYGKESIAANQMRSIISDIDQHSAASESGDGLPDHLIISLWTWET